MVCYLGTTEHSHDLAHRKGLLGGGGRVKKSCIRSLRDAILHKSLDIW